MQNYFQSSEYLIPLDKVALMVALRAENAVQIIVPGTSLSIQLIEKEANAFMDAFTAYLAGQQKASQAETIPAESARETPDIRLGHPQEGLMT